MSSFDEVERDINNEKLPPLVKPRAVNNKKKKRSTNLETESSKRRIKSNTAQETLNDGSLPRTPHKKKRIKDSSRLSPLPAQDSTSSTTKTKRRKKKLKVKNLHHHGLPAEFEDLQEDVVEFSAQAKTSQSEDLNWTSTRGTEQRELGNMVYIEKKKGFKVADKSKLTNQIAMMEFQKAKLEEKEHNVSYSTIQFAIATQKVFKIISLTFHGILAGIGLWHIVSVFSLMSFGYDVFVQYYQPLAMPIQSLYYFLLLICTVSVFDRYDVGRPDKRCCFRAFTLKSGAIAVIFYVLALIFSLTCIMYDDKLSRPAIFETPEQRDSDLRVWKVLNILRGVMVIAGWLVIALRPNTDRLTKTLRQCDEGISWPENVEANNDETVTKNGILNNTSTGYINEAYTTA